MIYIRQETVDAQKIGKNGVKAAELCVEVSAEKQNPWLRRREKGRRKKRQD